MNGHAVQFTEHCVKCHARQSTSSWFPGRRASVFPQQRKLMGSSAQNRSGVPEKVGGALVQSQVRFNRIPEKVPEKVWEALVQSQVKFNKVPEKVPEKVPVKVWEALVLSQVMFNRVAEKAPKKVPGSLGAKPSQVEQGSVEDSGEGSGQGRGGFGGAKPGQVQQHRLNHRC